MNKDKEKEKENIRFVVRIILYLLLAISFFSFTEATNSGVKPFIFYLFLSGFLALLVLSFIFIKDAKYQMVGYVFTIPFICFFGLIFIYSLFFTFFRKSMGGGVYVFFSNFGKFLFEMTGARTIFAILIILVVIVSLMIAFKSGQLKKG